MQKTCLVKAEFQTAVLLKIAAFKRIEFLEIQKLVYRVLLKIFFMHQIKGVQDNTGNPFAEICTVSKTFPKYAVPTHYVNIKENMF